MSIPTLLARAQEVASKRAHEWLGLWSDQPHYPLIELDDLTITMEPGLFRPRFTVRFPIRVQYPEPRSEAESVLQQIRDSLGGQWRSSAQFRGSMSEWLTYQGWLSGREFELQQLEAFEMEKPKAGECSQSHWLEGGVTGSGRGRRFFR